MGRVNPQSKGRLVVLVCQSRKDGVAEPDLQVDAGVELNSEFAGVVGKIEGICVVWHACDCVGRVVESMYAMYWPFRRDKRQIDGSGSNSVVNL